MQYAIIGVDVGSVSTDFVVINQEDKIIYQIYLKTRGNPIAAIQCGMRELSQTFETNEIKAVGTTGSGRTLAAALIGADEVKNEITAHGAAAVKINPDTNTVIEIGGQDSKIIILREGLVEDFAMNTVCAAGTGSFLDRQAERLGICVEELGGFAIRSKEPVRIAGRCAVFAESDLIHKQQMGYSREDIIAGMSQALVRNYLSNVAKGKEIKPPILFQGGVAANLGIKTYFEKELGQELIVPEYHKVMGAYGAALLAKRKIIDNFNDEKKHSRNEKKSRNISKCRISGRDHNYDLKNEEACQWPIDKVREKASAFKGFENCNQNIETQSFVCTKCSNRCEVVKLLSENGIFGVFSDRCGRYSTAIEH